MDYKKKKSNSHSLDKISVDNNNKSESKFAKGIRKITRKSSFSKDKRKSSSDLGHKHKDVDGSIPALSITVKLKETPILPDKNLLLERDSTGSPPPIGPNLVPLSKASSKSEDSLDSGIYSRQKSCDSMESVGSVSSNTEQPQTTSFVAGGMSPSEDHPPSRINESDYEVYWREVNNIRESIVSQTHSEEDVDVKKPVARTDSGDDEEDNHEADWLRQVGLADLVTSSSSPSNTMSTTGDRNSQISTESLSSMTVLSTLTRPQRAAVLRRITSFNRAQQTKRQPKPHIRAVFPSSDDDGHHDDGNRVETNLDSGKPPIASPPPSVDVTRSTALTDEEIASKTASLPHNLTGFDDVYHRRYSETPRTMSRLNAPDSGLTHSSMQGLGHVMKVGNKSHIKKGDMDSIIAAGNSEASSFDQNFDDSDVFLNPSCASLPHDLYLDEDFLPLEYLARDPAHFTYPPKRKPTPIRTRKPHIAPIMLATTSTPVKETTILTNPSLPPSKPPPSANNQRISSFLYQNKNRSLPTMTQKSPTPPYFDAKEPRSYSVTLPSPTTPDQKHSPAFIAFTSALSPDQMHMLINHQATSPLKTLTKTLSPKHNSMPKYSPNRRASLRQSLQRMTDTIWSVPHRTGSYKLQQPMDNEILQRTSSLRNYRKRRPSSDTVAMDSIDAESHLLSPRIESLSIRSRSTDDNSRWQSSDASSLHLSDTDKTKVMGYSETADHENLPNFSLVKDRLGITRISDLCDPDVSKVRTLSLIELTALFDLHGIELKRKKFGKTRIKESGTFGVPLTTLLEWDQKRRGDMSLRVPIVLQEIITFLEENGLNDEGILRVPGSAVRIKALKQELEERYSPDGPVKLLDPESGWGNVRTNDVAALLKQFLRELPNPLLTTEYIDAFISCELIPDRKQQLQALNLLILLLNPTHRDALKLLLKFLSRVVAREESNKMSLNNVAMIMAPNLFMGRKSSKREMPSATAANQDVKHAAGTSNIVRMLIKYHKLLWTVPTFMLTQVRNMNQAENSSKKPHSQTKDNKGRLKFLPGMSRNKESTAKKSSPVVMAQPFDYEVPKGVIRVQIQNHVMTSMAIQINAQTTAAEVIAKVTRQCERAKELSPERDIAVITNETHALYEVGGNIHERCLDPGTNMNMLTKVNSDATWVIKKRTAR